MRRLALDYPLRGCRNNSRRSNPSRWVGPAAERRITISSPARVRLCETCAGATRLAAAIPR
jgi:hypothetical protein